MKKIKFTALFLSLIMMALSLTSCLSILPESEPETQYQVSEHQLKKMLEEFYKQGDNLDININAEASQSLVAASKAVLSAVSIRAIFGPTSASAGSGVIYELDKENGDAYVITNYHVVANTKSRTGEISNDIKLFLYGQEYEEYAIPATYVGGSASYDLAVLKVKGSSVLRGSCATAVTFADSNDIALLETAIAIGNPESLGISATVGHISVDSEYIDIAVTDSFVANLRVMRTDASVNGGNSGGGLFNDKGELIGIVNAKLTASDNIGYAIPSNIAKYIADNILDYCEGTSKTSVYRCLMGVTVSSSSSYAVYDSETGKVLKKEDVEIQEVSDTGIAAGKLLAGDIIRKMTIQGVDYEVTRMYCVVDSMLNARVGDTVEVHIEREGTPMRVTMQIPASALTETP